MRVVDLLPIALAAARLTRLVRRDRIFDAPRNALVLWAMNRSGPDREHLLVYFLRCVWCVSLWSAAVAVGLWQVAPVVVHVLAVAYVAALATVDAD